MTVLSPASKNLRQLIPLPNQNLSVFKNRNSNQNIIFLLFLGTLISKLVCKDLFSINALVQSDSIQALIKKSFGVTLTRYSITENVSQTAKAVRKEVKKAIESKNIALCCDDWTSRQSIGFCNLIATVKNEFEKKHYSLGLIKLEATDGASIAEKILDRAKQFGIQSHFITTDGAGNMRTMAKSAGFFQQQCLIHGLQLVVYELIFTKIDKTGKPSLETNKNKSIKIFISILRAIISLKNKNKMKRPSK